MRRLCFLLLIAMAAGVPGDRAFAQDGGPGGAGAVQGDGSGGRGDRPAGAYASPSAIPDGRNTEEIGIPQRRGLQRFNAIALPEGTGTGLLPEIPLPRLPAFAPQTLPSMQAIRPDKALVLQARLEKDGPNIPDGLVWRLFSPIPAPDGKLPVLAVVRGGEAVFNVPAGSYLLHVGYGRAGMTKRIEFSGEQTRETVIVEAGGLRLQAVAADDVPIADDKLTFDIYSEATDEQDRRLIAEDVGPHVVTRLNAGSYHVVSHYGSVNAVVRADVRVEAGRITDATVRHHAAQLTMKLVRERGGEAIADTAWSISNPSGDLIRESVGAFPSMVLAEGDYVIVAKNKDRIFERDFTVEAGINRDVEVLTSDLQEPLAPGEGSGD